jgi:hypothetical protein
MAEERLVDDDKDKKYRFRKNENGEEELVIEGGEETESAKADEMSFEVPEGLDDEEAAVMTPEQLAERQKRKAEEKAALDKRVAELLDSAEADYNACKYATALESLVAAEELDDENGRLYALRLKVYTCGFTDYNHISEAAEAAENVAKYSSEEDKKAMLAVSENGLKANISATQKLVDSLSKENEEKKAERAVKFNADRNKAIIIFSCIAVPFLAMLITAIYFSTIMYSSLDGHYITYTIVFAAIAFVFFAALVFAARYLNITCRRVRLNNRNNTTKLGRQLLEEEEKLDCFNVIYNALKNN